MRYSWKLAYTQYWSIIFSVLYTLSASQHAYVTWTNLSWSDPEPGFFKRSGSYS